MDNGFFPDASIMVRGASISQCGRYRYTLTRRWADKAINPVHFVMLNPSTASATVDDPTILKCIRFARTWGYDALTVVNLFAYRATKPRELLVAEDPVGPENDTILRKLKTSEDRIVVAWGAKVPFNRDLDVSHLLLGRHLYCLGFTKHGYPRHPLYVPGNTMPILFRDALGVFERA